MPIEKTIVKAISTKLTEKEMKKIELFQAGVLKTMTGKTYHTLNELMRDIIHMAWDNFEKGLASGEYKV